jgi:hypothetical protein
MGKTILSINDIVGDIPAWCGFVVLWLPPSKGISIIFKDDGEGSR